MATIPILGQFNSVTSEQILAIAEQIKFGNTTVAAELAAKQNSLTFDSTPTNGSTNPVTSGGIYSALSSIQDALVIDNTPTANSNNLVKSGGVYSAIAASTAVATSAEFNEMLGEIFT